MADGRSVLLKSRGQLACLATMYFVFCIFHCLLFCCVTAPVGQGELVTFNNL